MPLNYQDESPTLAARADPRLVERVEEFATDHDLSKSEVMRAALEEYLPDDGYSDVPEDPELRQVYLWLKKRANRTNGTISGHDAINDLSQKKQMQSQYIKSRYLEPLRKNGWIDAHRGRIMVAGAGGDAE